MKKDRSLVSATARSQRLSRWAPTVPKRTATTSRAMSGRANVLAALAIADDETDLDLAGYDVQRAIAEPLLLVTDRLADPATRLPES
jgi:hypothetical protein